MASFWLSIQEFAERTTTAVGQQLLLDFGQVQAQEKADGSLVTQSDCWADWELRTAIAAEFANHGILSEEGEQYFRGEEWCWIIDPIDGTTNFTRGIPIWGISLGLLHNGIPVFGYAHFPPLNQSFHGYWEAPGQVNGAFLNQQPIHTRGDAPGANQFFSLCARSTAVLQQPFPCKIRMLGSASYNFLTVAAGATLGGVEATPRIWDIAATWVIVQAAGGQWLPLNQPSLFPLEKDVNYRDRAYPTLVTAQENLIPVFLPFVQFLGK